MALQGLDRATAPAADMAKRMLDQIGGGWWNVYIGGPESGGHGWSPEVVREYARHGINHFMLTYVGRQKRGPLTASQGKADAIDALKIATARSRRLSAVPDVDWDFTALLETSLHECLLRDRQERRRVPRVRTGTPQLGTGEFPPISSVCPAGLTMGRHHTTPRDPQLPNELWGSRRTPAVRGDFATVPARCSSSTGHQRPGLGCWPPPQGAQRQQVTRRVVTARGW